ncbi:MAG: sugar-binding protein, partial [Polyangiales bacterium]
MANRPSLCLVVAFALLLVPAIALAERPTHYPRRSEYRAPKAKRAPTIDGVADEAIWQQAPWQEITHRWLGPEYSPEDFQGRFKVAWTPERIYILAELVDDILFDSHRDPLVQYWDDDCLEIFLDEDYSGGDHQYNHNAFAYHVSLDNQAIDIGTDKLPHSYSHHVQ